MEFHDGLALAVSQNKYLSTEDNEMHAVLTVAANGLTERYPAAHEAAEVIVIDCSGSMSSPPTKIGAAKRATEAAVDALRDGVHFAVVEGTHAARIVYPPGGGLAAAGPEVTRAAKKAVRHLAAGGGTAMGAWLRLADELLATRPTAVRHAMLLTDGQNLPKYRQDLDDALDACAGRFVCDGRGIGDDYAPEELMRIAAAMRGTADAIIEDADLVPEFAALMTAAMGKVVPDVQLQIRTMGFSRLCFVRQTFPTEIDLTPFGVAVDARTTGFSTGSWGEEHREFHIGVEVDQLEQHSVDKDVQAAKVKLAMVPVGATAWVPVGQPQPVLVHWTHDVRLSSLIDPKVADSMGHAELGAAVKAGADAHQERDFDRAAMEWGRAVAMAVRLGADIMLTRLRRLVDIAGDPANGEVTLNDDLRQRDVISAMLYSWSSARSSNSMPVAGPEQTGEYQTCECGYQYPSTAKHCQNCGRLVGTSV